MTNPGAPTMANAALQAGASACFNKANAVREASTLIKQVKDAARGQMRPRPHDAIVEALPSPPIAPQAAPALNVPGPAANSDSEKSYYPPPILRRGSDLRLHAQRVFVQRGAPSARRSQGILMYEFAPW